MGLEPDSDSYASKSKGEESKAPIVEPKQDFGGFQLGDDDDDDGGYTSESNLGAKVVSKKQSAAAIAVDDKPEPIKLDE